jgi:8-oxo-dGTP pyrophosphatase MutT (NUDIX family)
LASSVAPLDITLIERAIWRRAAYRLEASCRASVVLILHPEPEDVRLLLIRRAQRDGDPWSGHMALPGGHREAKDEDDLRTALRETEEEIGLDLAQSAKLIGALDDIRASARGHTLDLVITPFVYQVGASPSFSASDEVAEVVWVSLSALANGTHFICHPVELQGRVAVFPGWNVADQIVWGLTYRILTGLLQRVFGEADRLSSDATLADLTCPDRSHAIPKNHER